MLATIIGAIIGGLIIGALARLILPGRQNISLVMTIVIGVLASLVGSWLVYQLGYSNGNGGFQWIPFIVGILLAAGGIIGYGRITSKA